MKNLLITFLICFTLISQIKSQDTYSTFTFSEQFGVAIKHFEFNNQLYFLASEKCNFDAFYYCAAIYKIENDGHATKVMNLGETKVGSDNIIESDNALFISGITDSIFWIQKFDSNFNQLDSSSFYIDTSSNQFYLKKMIEIGDYFVIVGDYRIFNNDVKEIGKIFQIDKNNLSLNQSIDIATNEINLNLFDIEILEGDKLAIAQSFQSGDPYSHTLRVNIFDKELQLIEIIDTDISCDGQTPDFAIVNENQFLLRGNDHGVIYCLDQQGDFLWSHNIEEVIDDFYPFDRDIFDIIIDQNGDIVVCGKYVKDNPNSFQVGFAMKISKDGELIWANSYIESHNARFVTAYADENGYTFTGDRTWFQYTPDYGNYWVVRTDLDGCIEGYECTNFILLPTVDQSNSSKDLFKVIENPSTMQTIKLQNNCPKIRYEIFNSSGELIKSTTVNHSNEFTEIPLQNKGAFFVKGINKEDLCQIEKVIVH